MYYRQIIGTYLGRFWGFPRNRSILVVAKEFFWRLPQFMYEQLSLQIDGKIKRILIFGIVFLTMISMVSDITYLPTYDESLFHYITYVYPLKICNRRALHTLAEG
jgi:hypothetical protein